MLFSSIIFLWFFLPAVLVLYAIAPKSAKNWVLLLASLFFYAFGEPVYVLLMIASILMNWAFGLGIHRFGTAPAPRRSWLAAGVTLNLLLLGVFKYTGFFLHSIGAVTGLPMPEFSLPLPIGISFYTFQAMSYLIDLYRKEIDVQKSPFKLGLYVSLFPQLIAGPIVRYGDVAAQIDSRTVTAMDRAYGIRRFILGLSKKVILSNGFAAVADPLFNNGAGLISTPAAWLGLVCYTLQIYYDFSGYSDMAIGLGRMFGFHFLENFNYPYMCRSVQDFWRRWHISLSTWFREYLYIPLGGNRKGQSRTLLNLLIVFLCTGLWHGANAQFIVWGAYFGVFLILERLFLGRLLQKCRFSLLPRLYSLLVVLLGWAIFRGNGLREGLRYIAVLFGAQQLPALTFMQFFTPRLALILGLGLLLCGPVQQLFPKLKRALYDDTKAPVTETLGLCLLLAICVILLVGNSYNPFIYFRF